MHTKCEPFSLLLFPIVASSALAQQSAPTDAEKDIAAQIKCEDFTKNANGSWTAGPNAKIGTNSVAGNTFSPRSGISIAGADLAVVLNQKCAAK